MNKIRVLLADDQEVIRTGLAIILNHQPDIEVVGQATNGLDAVALAKKLQPDVVLLDIKLSQLNGIQATRQIVTALPGTQVIILTTYDTDDWVFDGIRAGAIGYLLKDASSERLAEAVRGALRGESQIDPSVARKVLREFRLATTPLTTQSLAVPGDRTDRLTEREEAVLELLANGLTNKDIAQQLSLSEGMVKNYVSAILAKLHANDRTQAVLAALKRGLVHLT
jgi:DNA-binding NarL/FixJ family response regulator